MVLAAVSCYMSSQNIQFSDEYCIFLLIDAREGGEEGMVERELLHCNSQALLFAISRHSQPIKNEF